MNRTFLLLLMFVAVGFGIKADDIPKQLVRQIHGIVSDSKGEPLTGAAVSLKKKGTVATTTDTDGLFVLDGVPEKGTLQVSYFGYVGRDTPETGKRRLCRCHGRGRLYSR